MNAGRRANLAEGGCSPRESRSAASFIFSSAGVRMFKHVVAALYCGLSWIAVSAVVVGAPAAAGEVNAVSARTVPQPEAPYRLRDANKSAAEAEERSRYIVVLREPALASYRGGRSGLAAPGRQPGSARLDSQSREATNYVAHLRAQQQSLEATLTQRLGRAPTTSLRMQHAINALVLELSSAEAEAVGGLPEVRLVSPERLLELDTDVGPQLIGAEPIWNGSNPGSTGPAKGEGRVIGVIDSGINFGSPSFAAVGPVDAHAHVNPLGSGTFLGTCAASGVDAGRCNDKLIGGYDFVCAAPFNACSDAGLREEPGFGDTNGHGTHVASTAAGNERDALYSGNTVRISGVAPRANIIAYDVCYTELSTGRGLCPNTATIAAVDQAVVDGIVDVINYSISGGESPWTDATSLAFLGAVDAGIYVAASAGNSGPLASTLGHHEPWVSSTAAAQHGRGNFVLSMRVTGPSPVPANLDPIALSQGTGGVAFSASIPGTTPLRISAGINTAADGCAAYPANTFAGAIAVIRRGTCSFAIKVNNASAAGAVAVVIANNAAGIILPTVPGTTVPVFSVTQAGGDALRDFGQANPTTATAGIAFPPSPESNTPDQLAASSSRGPADEFDLVKPDVTAPGVRILAAYAGTTVTGSEALVELLDGTSMASPHQAGAVLLLRQLRPAWTVPELKSALQMTAMRGVLKEDGSAATPFDMGAGRIRVNLAANSGLLLDETGANFQAANPAAAGDPSTLNLASLGKRYCLDECQFIRRLRNPGITSVSWTAALSGLTGTVSPASFTLAPDATVELTITIDSTAIPLDGIYRHGWLELRKNGGTSADDLNLPVSVSVPPPVVRVIPLSQAITTVEGITGSAAVTVANDGGYPLDFTVDQVGVAPAVLRNTTSVGVGSGFRSTIYTDPAPAGSQAQFAADDLVVTTPTRITQLFVEGFVVSGAALTSAATNLTWSIYPDAAGLPAGNPQTNPAAAIWTYTATPTAAGVTTVGSSSISLNLDAAGQSVNLPAGRYWVVVNTRGTFANRFAWFGSNTVHGNTGSALLTVATNGTGNWVATAAFAGLTMRVLGEVPCDAAWLGNATPSTGTLARSTQQEVTVDLAALSAGSHVGAVCFATNDPVTPRVASVLNVTVEPARLAFTTAPSATAQVATAFPVQPQVTVQNGAGATLTGYTIPVALELNSGSGPLDCDVNPVIPVAGVASFSGCRIGSVGTATLRAISGSATNSTSNPQVVIRPGPPSRLVFSPAPSATATAGVAFAAQPTLRIEDALGNLVDTATDAVSLSVASGTGPVVCDANPVNAVAGIASFSGCRINTAGNVTLDATMAGIASATTQPAIAISAAAPAQLAFLQQPSDAAPSVAIAPPVSVRIVDAFGNLTASTASVAIAIGANPGVSTLGGTTSVSAVAGVATFGNLSLNNIGNGYTLMAASAGLTSATSDTFDIVCPATVVTNGNDSGAGSLRQIIADACPGSTITFAPAVSSVTLTTAELLINKDLNIDGGATGVTVTRSTAPGTPDFRVINITAGGNTTLSKLTVSNGQTGGFGAGIEANSANLTLNDCVVRDNRAVLGGGQGGGVSLGFGTLTMNRTLVENNAAVFSPGVYVFGGFATITDSTIRNNSGTVSGGGLRMVQGGGTLRIVNSTIANNTGSTALGETAIGLVNATVTATVINSTIVNNSNSAAGSAAIFDFGAGTNSVTLINTIVSGNLAAGVPADSLVNFEAASANNLIGTGGGLTNGVNGNIVGVNNPLVSAFGNYGGPTPTLALLPGSPAINAGNNAACAAAPVGTLDQRGIARPQQTTCDIGAYESRGFTLALTGGNNQSAGPGLAFANPLTATVTAVSPGEPVQGGVVSFAPPGAGASASLAPNPAPIGAGGVASSTATANAIVGAYNVTASSNGATPALSYALTNASADLSIDDVAITEGDAATSNATFTVTRTNSLTAFTVPYSITAGTAQAVSDYTATSGILSFAVGGPLTQTITVPVVGDLIVEGLETATLNLGALTDVTGTTTVIDGSGRLSITDNDSAVVTFTISVSQNEASSPMAFSVNLSNPVQSGVTLAVNSAFGTATAADFTPIVGGTVTFPANSNASQTVSVVINNDALDEDDETFTLTLSGSTAVGSVSLGANVATGTIVDDDLPPVISITSPSQLEGDAGNTPMDFVVSLSAVSGRDVSFTRATANGSATLANNDYLQLLPAGATILAGQTSLPITVQIVGDSVFEGNENFRLDLSNIVNATIPVPPLIEGTPVVLTGTGTIEDDDQQPTTTTITSDLPDASVVGQPYTVVVGVAAVSTSPLGTISISDGTDSCGPVTLTTGTAPNSSASCMLTSTTAGARTLTATYTPASTAFAASSDTEAHQVNAAATTISVVGPPRSRINQPTTFSFALSVEAPGAGSPAGTVTLTSGTATCNVSVPTATPSCALTFDTLGPRTVSAAFVPADGNFLGSSSSGAGNAQTLVFALSDIAVTKSDGLGTFLPGDLVVYTVTVRNLGADAAAQIRVIDNVPAGLVDGVWTCDASGGVACPAAGGSGNLDVTVASFPVGGLLNFTFYGNVDGSPAQLVNTALVELPADTTIEDPVPGNNSATDTNLLELLFRNGFEAAAVNAPAGSYRLPSASLRGTLDEVAVVVYALDDANGEALRVYARAIDGEVQYALAMRNTQGLLRLGTWASYASDPLLTWTARPVAEGWVLDSAGLR